MDNYTHTKKEKRQYRVTTLKHKRPQKNARLLNEETQALRAPLFSLGAEDVIPLNNRELDSFLLPAPRRPLAAHCENHAR